MRPCYTRRPLLVRLALALPIAGVLTCSSVASATEPAAAEALFTDAKKLMSEGKFAEACPKLEESQRLDPGMGTLFNSADCHERVGRIATAWAEFLEVASLAKAAGQSPREAAAHARASVLEPKLPHVVIAVTSPVSGLSVKRDEVEVGAAQWGVSLPIDPGSHTFVAVAPGRKRWSATVQASASTAPLTISVPALEVGEAEHGVVQTPGSSAPAEPTAAPGSGQRTTGLVVAAVGVVGLAIGTTAAVMSMGNKSSSASHCTGNECDPDGVELRDSAIRNGNIATVAFVIGGAMVAGGAVLWLTAPSRTASPQPNVGLSTTGTAWSIVGTW